MSKITVYRARWVLGFRNESHHLIHDGEVEFSGNLLTYVGPRRVDLDMDGRELREFGDGFLLPGFVSSHAHLCNHLGDRMMADTGRLDLFNCGFLNYLPAGRDGRQFLQDDDPLTSVRFGIGELLKSGVTTVVELGGEVGGNTDVMIDVAGEMGIRAYISPGYASAHYSFDNRDRLTYDWLEDDGAAQFERACEVAVASNGKYNDRIRGILVPVETVLSSRKLLERTAEESRRLNLPVTLHVAETIWEFHEMVRREQVSPLTMLHETGLLAPHVILGHSLFYAGHSLTGFPRGNDLEKIAAGGAHVSHSPFVFARRGIQLEGIRRYEELGINITIGTDSYPQDMLNEMRFASMLGKLHEHDFRAASARSVVNAATINGAKALGRDDIGRLEAGTKADLVVVDMARFGFGPMLDPVKSLVHIGSAADVEHVVVDGIVRVEDRRLTAVDDRALLDEVRANAAKVYGNFQKYDSLGRTVTEFAPPAFDDWA